MSTPVLDGKLGCSLEWASGVTCMCRVWVGMVFHVYLFYSPTVCTLGRDIAQGEWHVSLA